MDLRVPNSNRHTSLVHLILWSQRWQLYCVWVVSTGLWFILKQQQKEKELNMQHEKSCVTKLLFELNHIYDLNYGTKRPLYYNDSCVWNRKNTTAILFVPSEKLWIQWEKNSGLAWFWTLKYGLYFQSSAEINFLLVGRIGIITANINRLYPTWKVSSSFKWYL